MKINMPQFVQKVLTLSSFGIQQIVFRFDDNIRQHLKPPSAVATHVHVGPEASSPLLLLTPSLAPYLHWVPLRVVTASFYRQILHWHVPACLVGGGRPKCVFFSLSSLLLFYFTLFLLCDPPLGFATMHACGALYTAWKCRGFHFSFICVDAVDACCCCCMCISCRWSVTVWFVSVPWHCIRLYWKIWMLVKTFNCRWSTTPSLLPLPLSPSLPLPLSVLVPSHVGQDI